MECRGTEFGVVLGIQSGLMDGLSKMTDKR